MNRRSFVLGSIGFFGALLVFQRPVKPGRVVGWRRVEKVAILDPDHRMRVECLVPEQHRLFFGSCRGGKTDSFVRGSLI